jgi:RNA polymerase sigma factor (sigma-70 family)
MARLPTRITMAESEAVLLKRFTGTGDAEAFAEIIRRHAGLVYGAALRILADVDRASDVAQETFLQLTKDAAGVTGSLPGWLHRVATHKAIDQRRRDASRRHREKEYVAHEKPSHELMEWKDISPYVDVGLRELDPALRQVLILHFLEGHTTREIAAVQGTSQATISRRIGAGVEQLRARLRRHGVLVAVGALSTLLGDNAVQAAPLPLLMELGKMAMVGGAAVGTAEAGWGLHSLTTGVLAAIKTKVAAVAAVAVLGAASLVTYHELAKSSSGSAEFAAGPQRGAVGTGAEAETQWDLPTATDWNWAGLSGGETWHGEFAASSAFGAEAGSMAAAKYGGMMGRMMGAFDPPQEITTSPPRETGRLGDNGQDDTGLSQDPNYGDPDDAGKP